MGVWGLSLALRLSSNFFVLRKSDQNRLCTENVRLTGRLVHSHRRRPTTIGYSRGILQLFSFDAGGIWVFKIIKGGMIASLDEYNRLQRYYFLIWILFTLILFII